MSVIHGLAALARGGLAGIQSAQRDWSPFVVHLTSFAAMASIRGAIEAGASPEKIADMLAAADAESFVTFSAIARSGFLEACASTNRRDVPPCVCLSECSLPGVIGMSERYGRFGFVFRKPVIYAAGARPCAYLDRETHTVVAQFRAAAVGAPERRLFGLCNILCPPGEGRVQDYTHEREWRIFRNVVFKDVVPEMVLAPRRYIRQVGDLVADTPVIPVDTLFDWGA